MGDDWIDFEVEDLKVFKLNPDDGKVWLADPQVYPERVLLGQVRMKNQGVVTSTWMSPSWEGSYCSRGFCEGDHRSMMASAVCVARVWLGDCQ